MGETSPPGEESDGEEGGDALGKMTAVEDREGVTERDAEEEATDSVNFTGGIGVLTATTGEDD